MPSNFERDIPKKYGSLPITSKLNHRMVGFARHLCGSPSPTSLPKQGHPEQAAQDLVQGGLEYLRRRRLHNLPGQLVPVLSCLLNSILNISNFSYIFSCLDYFQSNFLKMQAA